MTARDLSGAQTSSRRSFIAGASLLAGTAASGAFSSVALARSLRLRDEPALKAPASPSLDEKFATVTPLNTWEGGGVWAVISKPADPFTVCNGGIIAGKDAVVLVDAYQTAGGAAWAASIAKALTGRDPTHVVLTHYHGDHTAGLLGYLQSKSSPVIISTKLTRELLAKRGIAAADQAKVIENFAGGRVKRITNNFPLPDAIIEDTSTPFSIDLGGKSITLRERAGHTPSDLQIEIPAGTPDGNSVVFAGDLIFNGVFPYCGDMIPSKLRANVAEVIAMEQGNAMVVPGHGALTRSSGLKDFLALIEYIAEQAKLARENKVSPKDAAQAFKVPESLPSYNNFIGRPIPANIVQLAFEAHEREFAGK